MSEFCSTQHPEDINRTLKNVPWCLKIQM